MTHFPFIGRALAPAALACSLLCLAPAALAQDAVKKELATRIVNLQKAQDMDALIAQLAGSANKVVVNNWLPDSTNFPQPSKKPLPTNWIAS